MEQLELFEGMQPIKLLHTWQEKRRRALLHDAGNRAKPGREVTDEAACERIQAASFSAGSAESSGQMSAQLVRKC